MAREQNQMPHILSPEGITIIIVAVFLDALGIIAGVLIFLFGIGVVLSYIPDFLGLVIIGSWSWFRTGKMPLTKKLKKFIKRPLLATVGEMIPVVGILPIWTLYVFLQLRKS